MQTFQEDLDKAKEKMLSQLSDRFSKLPEAGEAEASNGGDQLARNSQSDRNENGANQAPFLQNILGSNP
ncbi:hypothetical protein IQ247_31985 [Plectonema cf. radiosum LEGE 06105]|uniref:Uncharacterized protein n=1 Tax=Plectonema cf. radiosum LEGE 06105 TaxID=945769 RepID=A0A8J7F807_9CYAN|nr:hypothetical protein [Plectonema radiosum]MBE9217215.1 hypothetical protein [Plectonema cf. radiosum LEGE 06105]